MRYAIRGGLRWQYNKLDKLVLGEKHPLLRGSFKAEPVRVSDRPQSALYLKQTL